MIPSVTFWRASPLRVSACCRTLQHTQHTWVGRSGLVLLPVLATPARQLASSPTSPAMTLVEELQAVNTFRDARRSLNMWAHREFLEDPDVAEANVSAYAHFLSATAHSRAHALQARPAGDTDEKDESKHVAVHVNGIGKHDFFTLCHKISLVRTQEAREDAFNNGHRDVAMIKVPITTNATLEREWLSISRGADLLDEQTFTAAWRDLVTDDFESITCFQAAAYAARSRTLCTKLYDDPRSQSSFKKMPNRVRSAWRADEQLLPPVNPPAP